MPDRPENGLFSSTSAFVSPPIQLPDAPSQDLVVGRIVTTHAATLRKIAELIESARDAPTDADLLPFLDEALELARRG